MSTTIARQTRAPRSPSGDTRHRPDAPAGKVSAIGIQAVAAATAIAGKPAACEERKKELPPFLRQAPLDS